MNTKPQKEHEFLEKFVGEWLCEGEAAMEPGKPPVKWKAEESVRSLAGLWIVGEGKGETPEGGCSTTILTLGYDPQKGRYVGTFMGSMMTNLWVYDGVLDASGKKLTLDTEGPSMSGDGKLVKYQDIMEVKSNDERTLTSMMLSADGKWDQVMTATYQRKK